MQKLSENSGHSCHLAVLDGSDVVVVAHQESPNSLSFHLRAGAAFPIEKTISGRILLAHISAKQCHEYLQNFRIDKKWTEKQCQRFMKELDTIRECGYLIAPSQVMANVCNIVTVVGGHGSGVLAALSMPIIQGSSEIDTDNLLKAVQKTALKIESLCGIDKG